MNTCVQVKSIKQSSQLLPDQFGGRNDQITTFRKRVSEGRISRTHYDLTHFLSCVSAGLYQHVHMMMSSVKCLKLPPADILSRHRKKSSWFSCPAVVHMSCLSHSFHPNIVKILKKFCLFITWLRADIVGGRIPQSVPLNHSENIRNNQKTPLKELQSKLKNPV